MSVRLVMDIPFSEDNDQWFEDMDEGTIFTVTMNTATPMQQNSPFADVDVQIISVTT